MKVGIIHKREGPFKNLWVSISHGKETDNGIRLGEDKDGVYGPIDLNSHDEYFFNTEENCFYQNSKKIEAQQILSNIEEAYASYKKIKGFLMRMKLTFWRVTLPAVIKYIDIVLIKLLWIFSGESATDDIWKHILFGLDSELKNKPISKPEVQFKETKTLAFFGNNAKRWSVIFYASIHLIAYSVVYYLQIHNIFLSNMFSNNFLLACYVVVSFSTTESFIPSILKLSINKITPKLFNNIAHKKIVV